jgi:3-oxoacyl-[acyl-carrier protein] reductase
MADAQPQASSARLAGRTALVTGAARGIGRATALRLSRDGASVVLVDVDAQGAHDTAEHVRQSGGRALPLQANVTDRAQVKGVLAAADAAGFGSVDLLVNNAAVGKTAPFLEIDDADWQRMLSVNLTGTFIMAQEVARGMVRQGFGRIINIASLAAHTANSHQAAYAASKGAVLALTRVMAFELAPQGILVNAVSPGPIETELAASMLTPQARLERERRIPQGRFGEVADVAGVVAFLAGDDAAFINGSVIVVDGGLLISGIRDPGASSGP